MPPKACAARAGGRDGVTSPQQDQSRRRHSASHVAATGAVTSPPQRQSRPPQRQSRRRHRTSHVATTEPVTSPTEPVTSPPQGQSRPPTAPVTSPPERQSRRRQSASHIPAGGTLPCHRNRGAGKRNRARQVSPSLSLSLWLCLSVCLSLARSLARSLTFSLCLSLSLSLSLSLCLCPSHRFPPATSRTARTCAHAHARLHARARTHTHTHTHTHTRTHTAHGWGPAGVAGQRRRRPVQDGPQRLHGVHLRQRRQHLPPPDNIVYNTLIYNIYNII